MSMSIVEGCDGKWATSTAYSWILLEGRTGREWRIRLPREVQGRVWEDKHKEVIRKKTVGRATGGWAGGSDWQCSVRDEGVR